MILIWPWPLYELDQQGQMFVYFALIVITFSLFILGQNNTLMDLTHSWTKQHLLPMSLVYTIICLVLFFTIYVCDLLFMPSFYFVYFNPFPHTAILQQTNLECSLCWKKWTFFKLERFENTVDIVNNIFKCLLLQQT